MTRKVHGVLRVLVLVWAMSLVTWSIVYVLIATPQIGFDAAGVLTAIVTVLTIAVGFYEWQQNRRHSSADSES